MVSGAAHKTTTMIYQYNSDLQIVAEHRTLMEASKALGIPERTISAATLRGSFCRFQWYFSREMGFVPPGRTKGEKMGKKFTVMVSDEVWDRMLVVIGQRKKQDIFRHLLSEWLDNEERNRANS